MNLRDVIATLRLPLEELPDPLPLAPLPGPFDVTVTPPGSKSLTNRALTLAALADGETTLTRPLLEADDVDVMIHAIQRFGAGVETIRSDGGASLRIRGTGGRPRGAGELGLRHAGTAVRFLSALAALADGPTVIDGSARMRQRPIGGLASALRSMRVRVDFLGEYGYPPVRITPTGELRGGELRMPTPPSSQFLSALLMIAPWTRDGISIELDSPPLSPSYLRMTLGLLQRLGALDVQASSDLTSMRVAPGPLAGFELAIEPDATGATYFWAAAAITPAARCEVDGVGRSSVQGDARFVAALERMGAEVNTEHNRSIVRGTTGLRAAETDCFDMPDTAMTLAAAACFATGDSRLTGLQTLPVKECDRIRAIATELRRIGAGVDSTDDTIVVRPSPAPDEDDRPVVFKTYEDHRMAMSLALIGLRRPGVSIADPTCVAKTYPTFWRDLSALYEDAAARACPEPPAG